MALPFWLQPLQSAIQRNRTSRAHRPRRRARRDATLSLELLEDRTLLLDVVKDTPRKRGLGALTTAGGSIIAIGQIDGGTSVASLTVASGFTNNGFFNTRFRSTYRKALSGASTNLILCRQIKYNHPAIKFINKKVFEQNRG